MTLVVAAGPLSEGSVDPVARSTEVFVVTKAISELHICTRVWKDRHESNLEQFVKDVHLESSLPHLQDIWSLGQNISLGS